MMRSGCESDGVNDRKFSVNAGRQATGRGRTRLYVSFNPTHTITQKITMASAKERVIQINQRINALGRERRLSEALALLPYLRSQGLRPTAVTYNVLLSACTRCSDNVGAAKLLKEMAGEGLKPNIITYATVAKGLCLAGELQQADDVLSAAEKGGVEPNDRICTAFLRGCLVWGEVDRGIS